MAKYRLTTYDVWGNDKDGYEVNDAFRTSQIFKFKSEHPTDKQIINALRQEYRRMLSRKVEISGEGYMTLYIDYDGKPLCELVRED